VLSFVRGVGKDVAAGALCMVSLCVGVVALLVLVLLRCVVVVWWC